MASHSVSLKGSPRRLRFWSNRNTIYERQDLMRTKKIAEMSEFQRFPFVVPLGLEPRTP